MSLSLRVFGGVSALVLVACAGAKDDVAPSESGLCEVRWGEGTGPHESPVQHWTISMSEDTREVVLEGWEQTQTHRFDAEGKLVRSEYGGIPARPAADYVYDDHDRMSAVNVFGEPGESCTNTYDDDDRLIERACNHSHYIYGYEQGERIETLQSMIPGGDSIDITLSYDADDRIIGTETDDSAYAYAYRDDGQTTRMERDWAFGQPSDGTMDIRWTWHFRANGGVEAIEQDGTDHNDAPVIDGTPDLTWSFSQGCDAIGAVHPWIYNRPVIVDVGQPMPHAPY